MEIMKLFTVIIITGLCASCTQNNTESVSDFYLALQCENPMNFKITSRKGIELLSCKQKADLRGANYVSSWLNSCLSNEGSSDKTTEFCYEDILASKIIYVSMPLEFDDADIIVSGQNSLRQAYRLFYTNHSIPVLIEIEVIS